jgi:LmbE family N-acetylglucosaminyl deacetylase
MTNVLVVSPHPDDAEIGCGGMIHRLMKNGHNVMIAVCTGEGDLLMAHTSKIVKFRDRRREQEEAATTLGGAVIAWLDMAPASRFDTIPQALFVSTFDRLFQGHDQVFLPLPSYNDDHVRVWRAGLAAFRPGKLDYTSLMAYEQPFGNTAHDFGKRYIQLAEVDVEAKKLAITCHRSQMLGRDKSIYGRTGAELLATVRGAEIGIPYAEMVYVIKEVVTIGAKP